MLHIRVFCPADQTAIRALILAGLAERFGTLDPTLNPDLNSIQQRYIEQGDWLVVAEADGDIIGCGALIHENGSAITARIVRVSVDRHQRRRGVGRLISRHLIEIAHDNGFSEILVETNSDWTSALRLYQSLGFMVYQQTQTERGYTEIHMRLPL